MGKLYEYYDFAEVITMKYAIVGGDMRSAALSRELAADGGCVCTYALEKAESANCVKSASLLACLDRADCVILPVPVEKSGRLNTPLSVKELSFAEVLRHSSGQKLIGGMFSAEHYSKASEYGTSLLDIMKDEKFVLQNAALTAEAALGLIITSGDLALCGSRVLLCGYGRIGKALAEKLLLLGARLTVAARGEAAKTAAAIGCGTVDLSEPLSDVGGYDWIVNTVPARVLSDRALCSADSGAILMELASAPGGFNMSFGENIGLEIIYAPGLPGKYSPVSAARYMKDYIYSVLQEA